MVFQSFSTAHLTFLLQGTMWTILLAAIALVGGTVVGATIALLRVSVYPPLRWLAQSYIYVIQGTPLLVVLFIAYFGLTYLGIYLPPLAAAAVGLILYASAFLGEIWRGAIQAVGRGQWEGAEALGLSWPKSMRYVVVPQAIRLGVAPTVGFSVQVVKNTALTSIVGFVELTHAGQIVSGTTFQPLPVYVTVAAIYFVLCSVLSYLSRLVERRISRKAA
jgi:polar amino acid transport system permease protein